jgi:hypothetical protein
MPSYTVMYPPVAYRPAADARVTTSFCSFASGSQGRIEPRARTWKRASPTTSMLGSYLSARMRATVGSPAPGGSSQREATTYSLIVA